jgi:hypothetical protein
VGLTALAVAVSAVSSSQFQRPGMSTAFGPAGG